MNCIRKCIFLNTHISAVTVLVQRIIFSGVTVENNKQKLKSNRPIRNKKITQILVTFLVVLLYK